MLFRKDIKLSSPFTREIILERLRLLIHSSGQKFEGNITETEILLYPTFDYGPRNLLRPEIKGQINEGQVFFRFGLSTAFKALFIFALILNLAFTVILFTFSFSFWWLVLIFLLGFFLSAQFFYSLKVTESIRILSLHLNAKVQADK